MKKSALLAAAAALFVATPAMAQSGGSIGLGYTNIDEEGDLYQLDGAFGSANGSFGFQIDAGLGNTDSDFNTQTVAGHLYWNGGGWRLGGVIAHSNIDADVAAPSETVYGLEGTWNLGANTVLLGSYTIGNADFVFIEADTWNADIGLNHYFSDNLRIGGSIGTGAVDADGFAKLDTMSYRINGEWQPWTTPVSFTLGWSGFDPDSSDNVDAWSIGARWNFGGSTLRERDNATPFDTRTAFFARLYDLR